MKRSEVRERDWSPVPFRAQAGRPTEGPGEDAPAVATLAHPRAGTPLARRALLALLGAAAVIPGVQALARFARPGTAVTVSTGNAPLPADPSAVFSALPTIPGAEEVARRAAVRSGAVGRDAPFVQVTYVAPGESSLDTVIDFYARALRDQGWQVQRAGGAQGRLGLGFWQGDYSGWIGPAKVAGHASGVGFSIFLGALRNDA